MNLAVTLLLVGLLSACELMRAYHGSEVRQGRHMRWLNYATLITLALFLFILARQIVSLLTMP